MNNWAQKVNDNIEVHADVLWPPHKQLTIVATLTKYSKTSMTRTSLTRLPWLIRTRFKFQGNLSDNARKQTFRDILGDFFYHENACCVYSLELPHRRDSNEYT